MIMLQSGTTLSLTHVGVHLKKMFNEGKMPGYSLTHNENVGGSIVYYKQYSVWNELKKWFKNV